MCFTLSLNLHINNQPTCEGFGLLHCVIHKKIVRMLYHLLSTHSNLGIILLSGKPWFHCHFLCTVVMSVVFIFGTLLPICLDNGYSLCHFFMYFSVIYLIKQFNIHSVFIFNPFASGIQKVLLSPITGLFSEKNLAIKNFSVNDTMSGQPNKRLIHWHFEN